jgi:hypothetical protein
VQFSFFHASGLGTMNKPFILLKAPVFRLGSTGNYAGENHSRLRHIPDHNDHNEESKRSNYNDSPVALFYE